MKLNRFTKGLNNVAPETDLPEGGLRSAMNVDVTDKGRVRRRKGYTEVYSGTDIHSFYKFFFVEAGTLKYLNPDWSTDTLVSGLGSKPLSYCDVNGNMYFSNEDEHGTINGEWAVEDCSPGASQFTSTSGSLLAGTYLISFCFVNSEGELGGSSNPITINIPSNGAISIGNITQPTGDYSINFYMSAANGNELFLQKTLPKGTTSVQANSFVADGTRIDTLHMKELPTGHSICLFKGRIYVADGSTLWYSEAMRYGLYSPASNFFNFPERISVLQETENGLFVVADKIYYITGTDPKKAGLSIVGFSTGVEGTGIAVDGKEFGLDSAGRCAYWFGSSGAVLGLPNGQVKYVSEENFDLDVTMPNGTTGYREQNGISQLITNLFEQGSDGSAFAATDNAVAEVIRNGVVIN